MGAMKNFIFLHQKNIERKIPTSHDIMIIVIINHYYRHQNRQTTTSRIIEILKWRIVLQKYVIVALSEIQFPPLFSLTFELSAVGGKLRNLISVIEFIDPISCMRGKLIFSAQEKND
jgi:hypothetical protein